MVTDHITEPLYPVIKVTNKNGDEKNAIGTSVPSGAKGGSCPGGCGARGPKRWNKDGANIETGVKLKENPRIST